MPRALPLLAGLALLLGPVDARAQSGPAGADAAQWPAYRGRVDLFTLTPRGDIDGFVLADGTEVKTPPHLSGEIARAVKRGDAVTVHGLKAAALPLIQAVSISDDVSGRTVTDLGPGRRPPSDEEPGAAPSTRLNLQGRIRLVLHGVMGEANGALLDDGTVLRMPPPEAARLAALLVPGHAVAVDGLARRWSYGTTVEVLAIGASPDTLTPLGPARPAKERPR